ncbi:MAG: hypothetical protein DCF22_17225 [Leptolyngbya sp.]|nr:MAG: hypothetical protein DCF22_17225 [Leptolyngbya sp.]
MEQTQSNAAGKILNLIGSRVKKTQGIKVKVCLFSPIQEHCLPGGLFFANIKRYMPNCIYLMQGYSVLIE